MKPLLILISLAALAGCAEVPPGPPNYGTRYPTPADQSQWHVVSVTPVAPGTGDKVAATSGTGSSVQYSSEPIVSTGPVYVQQPVYVPQPVYYDPAPYYYPPVSLSLGFGFGRGWGWGGHREGHWGGGRFGGHGHR
jgi:hypothetical protein